MTPNPTLCSVGSLVLAILAGACAAAEKSSWVATGGASNSTSPGGSFFNVEFYATNMDVVLGDLCFAAFVANTGDTPAHLQLDYAGQPLPVADFARIPSGRGAAVTYGAYDPASGIPPGEVAILFLAGSASSMVPCPVPQAAVPTGSQMILSSGIGHSFHITSDVPVVAYQINPYGGASAAATGASLLIPTSAWDVNYIAVIAGPDWPSMNVVASHDGTVVTMLPKVSFMGGGGLLPGQANVPYTFTLNAGEHAQFFQADLTGSPIQSNHPIGFMAGTPGTQVPVDRGYMDHSEQMVPPVKALGHEYAAVMFRPRSSGDQGFWHLVGAVDGTQLAYSTDVGGPASLASGQVADFITDEPFVVQSQDQDHPFMLFLRMSGALWSGLSVPGMGDPDFVLGVPPQQYLNQYVFFADPTYPETNLVVVRTKNAGMAFDDVTLDCAGTLGGWQPVGDYEWTRVDLTIQGQNVGNCSTGRHQIQSMSPFGLWVWGWADAVSYGYPGGMNVQPINQVVIPPVPK
jgi:hypothetical protein